MAVSKNRKSAPPKAPPEPAASWAIVNPETGQLIDGRNPDEQRDPASLTKLMTAYMAMRAVKAGKLDLDSEIRISAGAAALGNNTLDVGHYNDKGEPVLPQGSKLTVREALTVMMTSSANGVAKALGEALAPDKLNKKGKSIKGSERDFAREMTRVAGDELGMKNSRFINASGLNDGGADQKSNLSTARDMAVLNARMMKDFPGYERMLNAGTATTRVTLPDGQKVTRHSPTTNHFTRNYAQNSKAALKEGFHVAGPQKTGFNKLTGGINLLATAENEGGVRLTSVVLGGRSSDKRYAANLRNLRNGFAKLKEQPDLAVAFTKPQAEVVALLTPASAFNKAGRKKNNRPARETRLAAAYSAPPSARFQDVAQRVAETPAVPAAVVPAALNSVGFTAPDRVELSGLAVSLNAGSSSHAVTPVVMPAADAQPEAVPLPVQPEPVAVTPVVYRPPAVE